MSATQTPPPPLPASNKPPSGGGRHGVELVSTGGTAQALREPGSRCGTSTTSPAFPR